jgi:hypothetical protein
LDLSWTKADPAVAAYSGFGVRRHDAAFKGASVHCSDKSMRAIDLTANYWGEKRRHAAALQSGRPPACGCIASGRRPPNLLS